MKKVAAIGLLSLLLCHILAYVLVTWIVGWQEESDLTNRLSVYRSGDTLVEFYIPLGQQATAHNLLDHTTEGFVYRDSYYGIVRREIKTVHYSYTEKCLVERNRILKNVAEPKEE